MQRSMHLGYIIHMFRAGESNQITQILRIKANNLSILKELIYVSLIASSYLETQ